MIENFETELKIIHSKGRYLRIKIDGKTGDVYLYIPSFISKQKAMQFVQSKKQWIQKTQASVLSRLERETLPKGEIWIFGNKIDLVFKDEQNSKEEGSVYIPVCRNCSEESLNKAIVKLYKSKLSDYLSEIVRQTEDLVGIKSSGWTIRQMSSRWGSCNVKTGKMTFALNLAKKKKECIEYVVLHEIAHLRYSDHGKGFKQFLTHYMPDWKKRKNLLNGVN